MAYDGEIKINTTIDTSKAVSQLMSLENRMVKLGDKIADLKKRMAEMGSPMATPGGNGGEKDINNTGIAVDKLTAQMDELRSSIELAKSGMGELRNSLDLVKNKMNELSSTNKNVTPAPTTGSDYQKMGADLETIKAKMDELKGSIDLTKSGIVELKSSIELVKGKMDELSNSSKTVTPAPGNTDEYNRLAAELEKALNEIDLLKIKYDELKKKQSRVGENSLKVGKKMQKSLNEVGKSVKKTNKGFSSMGVRLKSLILGALIFNQISAAIRNMIEGLKEGLKNLAQYSTSYNKTMSDFTSATETLKNTLATFAEPILNAVIPALTSMINWLITGINTINQFIATLSGKATFTKAVTQQKDYAKSLKATGAAAKEASTALAGFDDLDVLKHNDSAGGAGGAGTDASSMFEEVPIENDFSSIDSWIDILKQGFLDLWKVFADAFNKAMGGVKSRLETILNGIESIIKSIIGIFSAPDLGTAVENFIQSIISTLGSILGAVGSIGLTIAANLVGGLSMYLEQNSERIKGYLISMIDISSEVNKLIGDFFAAFANVFSAFAGTNGQRVTASLIGIFAGAFMLVTELAAKFASDILSLILQPFIDNQEGFKTALDGTLGVIAQVLEPLVLFLTNVSDAIQTTYDEHIHPFFENVTNGITTIVGTLLNAYTTYVLPMLNELAALLGPFVSQYITPLFTTIIGFIGSLIDILNLLWVNVLQPFINWIATYILPILSPIFSFITKGMLAIYAVISTVIQGVIGFLKGLLDFIVTGFTEGWDTAWENLKTTLLGVWNGIVDGIKGAINLIIGAVNGMISAVCDGINFVIDALNELSFEVPDWVPEFGGETFGFDISNVTAPQIPYLANGGITTGATLAAIGEAGREAVLPLEQNTDWMEQLASVINNGSRSDRPAVFEMDGEIFARLALPYMNGETNRIGVQLSTV